MQSCKIFGKTEQSSDADLFVLCCLMCLWITLEVIFQISEFYINHILKITNACQTITDGIQVLQYKSINNTIIFSLW